MNCLLLEKLVSGNKTKWAKEDLFLPPEQEIKLHILNDISKVRILLGKNALDTQAICGKIEHVVKCELSKTMVKLTENESVCEPFVALMKHLPS